MNPEHLVLKKMALEQSIVEISHINITNVKVPDGATLLYTTAPRDGYEKLNEYDQCISDTLAMMIRLSHLELVHSIVELKPEITFEGKDALMGLDKIAHLGVVRNMTSDENIVGSTGIPFGSKTIENSDVNFIKISFCLTKSGFDLGLRYIEHEDQDNRFNESLNISKHAAEASASSASTAKRALFAAVVIAIGSLGHLTISILKLIYP